MNQRPNILLIMTDQQRWDTICERTPCRTPNINRVASEGVTFERSYTPVSLCCPARAMLQSGAYGWHNGVLNQIHVPQRLSWGMNPGTVTYAMRLAEAGYQTGYVGKWHADWLKGPHDYGYRRVSAPMSMSPESEQTYPFTPEDMVQRNAELHPTGLADERVIHWPGGAEWPVWREHDGPIEGRENHFVAERGSRLIEEFSEGDDPWLLEVHFREPHDPFEPHVEFARRYEWQDIPLPDNWHEDYVNKPGMCRKEHALFADATEEDVRQAIAHYWAYVEELDSSIGRILDTLARSGQADNTLVVLTSDHGEMLGNHGMFIKGWPPYEETHRIPMVARWPGHIPAGSTASQLVQLHDWAHTFCDIAGVDPLPYADGVSLLPTLQEPSAAEGRRSILNVYHGCEFLFTQRILITRRYKYVFNGFDIDELYDLETDRHEMLNRIDDPELQLVAQVLRHELYRQMEALGDPYSGTWLYHAGRYLAYAEVAESSIEAVIGR